MNTRPAVLALGLLATALCGCHKDKPHTRPGKPSSTAGGAAPSARPSVPPPGSTASAAATPSAPGVASDQAPAVEMPEPPTPPTARPDASGPDLYRAIFQDYGFPGYPQLVHLCGRRVYQQGGEHITWDAFASSSTPAQLVVYFKRWLGARGFKADPPGGAWRIPEASPSRTLRIGAASGPGPWKSCSKHPPPAAKSVIMLSRR